MKWASTIPSGGGGSSAIRHLRLLGSRTRLRRGPQTTVLRVSVRSSFRGRVAIRTAGGSRGTAALRGDRRRGALVVAVAAGMPALDCDDAVFTGLRPCGACRVAAASSPGELVNSGLGDGGEEVDEVAVGVAEQQRPVAPRHRGGL